MAKKYVDLQMHSVYSDGDLNPRELVQRTKKEGVSIISLTDHNCIDGVKEAMVAGKKEGIKVIPGLELYTKFFGRSLHLLGYGFDVKNEQLNKILKNFQADHLIWAQKALEKAAKIGLQVNLEQIFKTRSKYIGLWEIIDNLRQNPQNEAFFRRVFKKAKPDNFKIIRRFFIKGAPAYVPEKEISTSKAIKLISLAGGISVLAHPGQQIRSKDVPLIKRLKKKGLDGLEVLSPHHSWHQVAHYQRLALYLDLLISGGSDFHGDILDKDIVIKNEWIYFKVPYSVVQKLCQKINL